MTTGTLNKPSAREYVEGVMKNVVNKNPGEKEFHQAVEEVLFTLVPALEKHPEYVKSKLVERIVEPERTL